MINQQTINALQIFVKKMRRKQEADIKAEKENAMEHDPMIGFFETVLHEIHETNSEVSTLNSKVIELNKRLMVQRQELERLSKRPKIIVPGG